MVPKDELRGVVAWMPGSRLPERLVPMVSTEAIVAYGVDPGFLNAWCPHT